MASVAYVWYFVAVLRDPSKKPRRSTWLLLAAISILLAIFYWMNGALMGETLLLALTNAIGGTLVAILVLFRGSGGWEIFDKIAFAGVAAAGAVYLLTGNPAIAYAATLAVDAFAVLPTLTNVWKHPKEEPWLAWAITVVGDVLSIAAIDAATWARGDWEVISYPIYLTVFNGAIFVLALRRERSEL